MPQYVWLVESGEYEDRGVWGVYSSIDAAIQGIKAPYGPPYIVEWSEPEYTEDGGAVLKGRFGEVPNYSVGHVERWDIERWEVDRA